MVNALVEGEKLSMDTVQVFTKNQQQWKARPLDGGMVKEWRAEVSRLGWEGRTVSHASYLINLASKDTELWTKSVELMADEIERCEQLAIPFLVHHPGSFVSWKEAKDPDPLARGLERIAEAYKELFRRTKGYKTVSCLEGTVGSGSLIGGRFEELATLRGLIAERTGEAGRVGYCLDTCHMHAAGYDISTRALGDGVLEEADRVLGLTHVRVLHLNDSKAKAGSRLDRHEHIGKGTIGKGRKGGLAGTGFASVVNRRELRGVPKILETPKGKAKSGAAFDTQNLGRLRKLVEGAGRKS